MIQKNNILWYYTINTPKLVPLKTVRQMFNLSIFLCFCLDTYILIKPPKTAPIKINTYFEVDILKALDQRILKMVLVLIGVQQNWFCGTDKVWLSLFEQILG